MKLLLAAATAATALVAAGSASAQSMYGHGFGYSQNYQRPVDALHGSSYVQPDWGRRDLTGYTVRHRSYNRGGYAVYGLGQRYQDDWLRNQPYGPMSSQVYPAYGVSYALPLRRAHRHHW